jgi:hypothetical protein
MFSPILADAGLCQATSGPQRVALLELYTSEGCSSCPPADRWLSGITRQGWGPQRVVPLALHVDYWNYIGWPDRFAHPSFSARQRALVAATGGRVVYTPQVMLNGRDFPGWRSNELGQALAALNRQSASAEVSVTLNRTAPDRIEMTVVAKNNSSARAALYVAVFQNGLSSDVRTGENRGVRLHHDYVVRDWQGPIRMESASPTTWQYTLTLAPDWDPEQMGVAAFVQGQTGAEVLQAVQLRFCPA